jgi:RimJ/RimL family protein N-acetyltransferase
MYYELRTARTLLRPLNINDIETVHVYASDIENTRYMMWLPNTTKEETTRFVTSVTQEWQKENPRFYEFAVILDGQHIGAVSVYVSENRREGELGWILNKKYWGKGYATEAAGAVKDFALSVLKVEKLTAHCDCRNVNSYKLMERIGLVLENDKGTRTYPKTQETARELTYSSDIRHPT